MHLKNIKKRYIAAIASIGVLLIFISGFAFFAEKLAEYALARGGLAESRIADIDFGARETVLTNITLPRLGVTISEMRVESDVRLFTRARLSRVVIKGITWEPPAQASEDGTSTTDIRTLLATLDTYSDEIEIADISLRPAAGVPPLTGQGKIYDRGDRYQVQFALATPEDTADASLSLSANLHADLFKKSGAAKLQVELENLSADLPPLLAKRVGGWLNIELPADPAAAPLVGAEITAGVLRVFDIPLTATTLTVSGDAHSATAALSARLPEKAGAPKGNGLQADLTLARPQDGSPETLSVRIEGLFEDLGTLGISGVAGHATLKVDARAVKPADTDYQNIAGYTDIGGTFTLAVRNLSLGKTFDRATASLAGTLAFDPTAQKVMLESTAPVSFQARRTGGTWGLGADHAGATYDLAQAQATLDIRALSATSPDLTLRNGAIALAVTTPDTPVVSGDITATVESLHKPAFFVPLTVALKMTPVASRPHTTGLAATISGGHGALMVKAEGQHDSATQRGTLRGRLIPLVMQPEVSQLSEYFPVTSTYLDDVTGDVRALAAVEWARDSKGAWQVKPRGGVMLRDVAATYSGFPIVGINTVLSFDSLLPLAFTRQQVAVGAFTAGLPLQNGLMTMSLSPAGVLSVHDGRMNMAGGKISVAPFTLDLTTQNADIALQAEGLEMQQLFAIAPLEGLSAEGIMAGHLPMTMRAGALALKDGKLESVGGGMIRYNPREVPAFLQDGGNPYMTDLRTALANFAFSSLKMGLSGDLLKEQTITLNIEGKNPDFYGGHPVKLNLNVEGPLQSIVKYAPGSDNIPDAIQKQFEQFEDADATVAH